MDKVQFKDFFDSYFDAIRRFVYYRCADEEVASDITQDVFMRVWEKRDRLDVANLKSLLYKIANDMTISYFRKSAVRLDFAKHAILENHTASVHDDLQFEEFKNMYILTLQDMPPTQREVFLMSREEDLKYGEIAERLGLSVKAIEKRMSAALKLLKTRLY
ncbi:DNA-directed RNA polymerase sigma-70 factor [Bacteroidales bacterium]|nr:DNA-directed RNA polymerase sigma-70 factor [Bacteroidales bacterium]